MKTLIEGYQNFPGEHCGSVAMRGLLAFNCGLSLSEDVVFGLGAGAGCVLLSIPGASPSTMVFGRTATMEVDLAAALGIDYVEQPDPDDKRAWNDVREEVLAGRPTMLTGDILYLDYRDYKVHFPAHRFVLLGFDDEKQEAYIADRMREEPEVCSYDALSTSRNPPEGMSTHNLWGRFRAPEAKNDLRSASRIAIATCTRRMLGDEDTTLGALSAGSSISGIEGIRRLAADLPGWCERDDAAEVAAYNSSSIERFGNGGGNFRRLYAGFLEWARELDPECVPADSASLALQAADGWTALSALLWDCSKGAKQWGQAAARAEAIAEVEERLFEGLAESSA